MLQFTVNKEKTINALHYLICEANKRDVFPTQYELVKAVFLADRAHLNKFGRPITFDSYMAMLHGPVPSFAYDALKQTFNWKSVELETAPWLSKQDGRVHRFSSPNSTADSRKLSTSDQNCLSDALGTVLSLTFEQIRRLTHEDRAYVSAWRDEEGIYAFPIDMSLLLDEQDDGAIDDLRYLAEHATA